LKAKKLIWILIEDPNAQIVQELMKAIKKLNLTNYVFIATPSTIRPISLKVLKKYLETLIQQVKELEVMK